MPVQNLLPLAEGNYTSWTLGAGASKVVAVQGNDGDTTYIDSPNEGLSQSFTVTNKPIDITSVNTMKIYGAIKSGDSRVDANFFARLSGADGSAVNSENTSAPNYTSVGPSSVARPGGGNWGPSDISSSTLEVCITDVDSTTWASFHRCTELGFQLDYEIPATGAIFLLISSLAVGAAPLWDQMPAMARALALKTGTWFRPDELEWCYRALRGHAYPQRVFMGA